jgi:hypothetical protein
MDAAFVVMWKQPFPGREQKALEWGVEAEEFWGKQTAEGRCATPEWFFFPTGLCMWMVKGDREVLENLVTSDEGRHLLVRGNLLMQDWQYMFAETGTAAERFVAEWAGELATI